MKTRTMGLVLLLSSLAVPAFAFDSAPAEPGALYCYAHAMVGFDSVINSRLGVPAELTVGLATKNTAAADSHENYAQYMVKVVLDAYKWKGSQHDYAVGEFYHCAQHQATILSTLVFFFFGVCVVGGRLAPLGEKHSLDGNGHLNHVFCF